MSLKDPSLTKHGPDPCPFTLFEMTALSGHTGLGDDAKSFGFIGLKVSPQLTAVFEAHHPGADTFAFAKHAVLNHDAMGIEDAPGSLSMA